MGSAFEGSIGTVRRFLRLAGTLTVFALAAACGPSDQGRRNGVPIPAPGATEPAPARVYLLDRPAAVPVAYLEDIPLSRAAVTWEGRTDTVPAVLVRFLPVLLNDSTLTGLDWSGPSLSRGFRYRRGARSVEDISLPDDLPRGGLGARLSPDGRHIAYVSEVRCRARHCARVTVRRWPSLERIAAHDLSIFWGDRLDPRDRINWLDAWRVAFELYDGQRDQRTVALVRLAAGGLMIERQPIPRQSPD